VALDGVYRSTKPSVYQGQKSEQQAMTESGRPKIDGRELNEPRLDIGTGGYTTRRAAVRQKASSKKEVVD
jgi:hypothetical protein